MSNDAQVTTTRRPGRPKAGSEDKKARILAEALTLFSTRGCVALQARVSVGYSASRAPRSLTARPRSAACQASDGVKHAGLSILTRLRVLCGAVGAFVAPRKHGT